MPIAVIETRAILLASLVVVMTETVGVGDTTQLNHTLLVAQTEQVTASDSGGQFPTLVVAKSESVGASETRVLRLDLLVARTETIGAGANPQAGLHPLFISVTERIRVWDWRTFPLGEHELVGVPIRIFMKGRT